MLLSRILRSVGGERVALRNAATLAYEMSRERVTLNKCGLRCDTSFKIGTTMGIKTLEKAGKIEEYATHSGNTLIDKVMEEQEYQKAIAALNGLQSNADALKKSVASVNRHKTGSLEDMVKYLERSGLSLNDLDALSVIHVSGTKGKGSTCALVESILLRYGVKTGFFSSPHLVSVTERLRINGMSINKSRFTEYFWRIYKRLEETSSNKFDMPPYFKFLTILCFHLFLEEGVDVAVMEVGIGGELDPTNIIRNTKTVGITSLGLEHTALLGDTLEQIAWQKAGIIKPQAHVYTAASQLECLQVIKSRALEKEASLHIVPHFSEYLADANQRQQLSTLNYITQLNGSLAIQLAYDWLRQQSYGGINQSYDINTTQLTTQVMEGLLNCKWPGRCELVRLDNFNIHLDGAHTAESMSLCSHWFQQLSENSPHPKVLIFNITGDRSSHKLLQILRRHIKFDQACFTPNISAVRQTHADNYDASNSIEIARSHAKNWELLCEEDHFAALSSKKRDVNLLPTTPYSPDSGPPHVFGSILECLQFLRLHFGAKQQVDVLVTGSLHLIGATVLAMEEYKATSD